MYEVNSYGYMVVTYRNRSSLCQHSRKTNWTNSYKSNGINIIFTAITIQVSSLQSIIKQLRLESKSWKKGNFWQR